MSGYSSERLLLGIVSIVWDIMEIFQIFQLPLNYFKLLGICQNHLPKSSGIQGSWLLPKALFLNPTFVLPTALRARSQLLRKHRLY